MLMKLKTWNRKTVGCLFTKDSSRLAAVKKLDPIAVRLWWLPPGVRQHRQCSWSSMLDCQLMWHFQRSRKHVDENQYWKYGHAQLACLVLCFTKRSVWSFENSTQRDVDDFVASKTIAYIYINIYAYFRRSYSHFSMQILFGQKCFWQ